MFTKPMLAGKCSDTSKLFYPALCTPKLDGIRCLTLPSDTNGCKCVSRTFKPIPNRFIRGWIESNLHPGLDGELMVKGATFQETTGHVMREDRQPNFTYHIFDLVSENMSTPYYDRIANLTSMRVSMPINHIQLVLPVTCHTEQELLTYEAMCLSEGYEGIMIRHPRGIYKCGRSTEREGLLLKLKRFEDCEGIVVGISERMSNQNEAEKDAFGRTKRSTKKEGLVPAGTMGEITVRCDKFKNEFGIGTGFDDALRLQVWKNQSTYMGATVKFKHQPIGGTNDAPRFPVFLGFRHKEDM